MARTLGGKNLAKSGKRMIADYGQRAALALDRCVPGPHRDKAVARLFNVSPRMARFLRAGRFWTVARLSEASAKLRRFDEYIAAPNIHARLDELAAEIAALREEARGDDDR